MYKKMWCTCEVVVLLNIKPIVFFFWRSRCTSASLDLKVPIVVKYFLGCFTERIVQYKLLIYMTLTFSLPSGTRCALCCFRFFLFRGDSSSPKWTKVKPKSFDLMYITSWDLLSRGYYDKDTDFHCIKGSYDCAAATHICLSQRSLNKSVLAARSCWYRISWNKLGCYRTT